MKALHSSPTDVPSWSFRSCEVSCGGLVALDLVTGEGVVGALRLDLSKGVGDHFHLGESNAEGWDSPSG